jgi:hypothetical protein
MKRINLLIMMLVLTILMMNVNAETYFTNSKGVEMTKEEYFKIVELLSETRADTITQEQFEHLLESAIIDRGTLYQKIISNEDGIISEEYISEEEYENASDTPVYVCDNNINNRVEGYIETTYKRFNLTLSNFGNNDYEILGSLTWKRIPACRSYDVFAFRTNYMSYSGVYGIQTYYKGSNYTHINYNSSSLGYNSATNGAGFSMNLKDDTDITKFEMTLLASLAINNFNYSTAHVYASYQHAQSSVTQAQSLSYSFSAAGLGDVIDFSSSTISNKYDGMAGIHLSTPIP